MMRQRRSRKRPLGREQGMEWGPDSQFLVAGPRGKEKGGQESPQPTHKPSSVSPTTDGKIEASQQPQGVLLGRCCARMLTRDLCHQVKNGNKLDHFFFPLRKSQAQIRCGLRGSQ